MDNLYALALKATRAVGALLSLLATATAISIGTAGALSWVGISALAAYYAHRRLGQMSVQV